MVNYDAHMGAYINSLLEKALDDPETREKFGAVGRAIGETMARPPAEPNPVKEAWHSWRQIKRTVLCIRHALEEGLVLGVDDEWKTLFLHHLEKLDRYLTGRHDNPELKAEQVDRILEGVPEVFYLSDGGYTRLQVNTYSGRIWWSELGDKAYERWEEVEKERNRS